MAKKKSDPSYLSGYIPASYTPNSTASQIAQIPPYDDSGVSFKGYSKRIKTMTEYALFPQIRRFQSWLLNLAGPTSGTGARIDLGKTFYVAHVHVDYLNSTGAPIRVDLIDGSTTEKIRYSFYINNDAGHLDLDFIGSPRDFSKDNQSILFSAPLAAGNYCFVQQMGWAE